ncbi:MAG: CDP-glycerol glycerophosphotransferase family protein [Sandaracinus sp.]|nr:CDP-glycerol glycerophosphotransferase family protein [Sandaracinus sp.]
MNRKLKKLIESPDRFFRDAVQKRTWRARASAPRMRHSGTRRFSVVTAVYNASPFLDDFLTSLARQSLRFGDGVELIAVDDGSTDDSLAILRRWAERFPTAIKVFHKTNGGQASARNVGLEHATGDWVTFIDPDDFVATDYFERVDQLLSRPEASDTNLVSCNLVFYLEKTNSLRDNHPLKFRFAKGDQIVRDDQLDTHLLQLSASSAFFRRDLLEASTLRFDESIRPVFEDAHFVARYLLAAPPQSVGLCASAIYYYRKRADESSTMDRAWTSTERFTDLLKRAHLPLLSSFGEGTPPPVWLQRTILYDIAWYFRRLVDHSEHTAFLSPQQTANFREQVVSVLHHMETHVILDFELCGIWLFHKLGWLHMTGRAHDSAPRAYVDSFDETKQLFRIRHFHTDRDAIESVSSESGELELVFEKTQRHDFAGQPFLDERILWFKAPESDSLISMQIGEAPASLALKGRRPSRSLKARDLRSSGVKKARPESLRWYRRLEHGVATSTAIADRFRDCWLFMDRDTQADDNAEHLYRYVRRERPDINAFFVLRRSSHDWSRLQKEGFRLLDFGGPAHRAALTNACHVISSHVDRYVVAPMPDLDKTALRRFKVTFLQHGVTKDDISNWLNPKPIDLLITASRREHESIVSEGSPYRYCDREVALTGFPRHDALGAASAVEGRRVLTLMPTWRLSLAGRVTGDGNTREKNPGFARSQFAREWMALLRSPRLLELRDRGYEIDFFPHANLVPYIDDLRVPEHVRVKTHVGGSIQDVFRRTTILVTDYSSTAFELAYLGRPIVYFQFDRDEVFGGGHLTRPGYFDYDRDGFGPVCTTVDAVEAELARLVERNGQPDPVFVARMNDVFAFRDGGSCARVLAAIEALDATEHPRSRAEPLRLARARRASRAKRWDLAHDRWSSLPRGVAPYPEREVRLAEAQRELGQFVAAARTLNGLSSDVRPPEARRERALLLSAVESWSRAVGAWREELERCEESDRPFCALALAEALLASGEAREAMTLLEAHPDTRPKHAQVYAAAAMALEEWSVACDALAPFAGTSVPLALSLADALDRSGDGAAAIALLATPLLASEPEAQRMAVRLQGHPS